MSGIVASNREKTDQFETENSLKACKKFGMLKNFYFFLILENRSQTIAELANNSFTI